MKKAIGYVRVSTKEQDDKFGIKVQKDYIEKFARENDYEIVEWISDTASGVKESRVGWDRILFDSEMQNPPFEAVIVFKSDRVARDINLYFYFLHVLEKKGVNLIAVEEDFGVDTIYAPVLRALVLTIAEQERRNITLRTSGGRAVKAKNGGYAGGHPPFGYDVDNGKLVINIHESNIVRLIFDYRNQGFTYGAIASKLNDRGLYTKKGGLWSSAQVFYIIKNENTYRGYYKYGKTNEWVKGQHEPIL